MQENTKLITDIAYDEMWLDLLHNRRAFCISLPVYDVTDIGKHSNSLLYSQREVLRSDKKKVDQSSVSQVQVSYK